ncbi:hypothetical protein [Nocardia spumae]|uniref:hypothetical protein n=1 Tax=Nocardia spumae TaxID=2887190 RepID=UPI001D13BB21|nr:hypothetical protein [Nocardia spumae]
MFPAVADRTRRASAAEVLPAPGPVALPTAGSGEGERIPIRPLAWRELADLPFAVLQHRIRTVAGPAGGGFVVALGIVLGVTALVTALTDGSSTGNAWAAVLSTACCAWALRLWIVAVTVPIGLAVVYRQPITARTAVARLPAVAAPLLADRLISTLIGFGILALGAPLVVTLIPATIWLGRVRGRRWSVAPILFAESVPYSTAVARSKLLAAGRVMPLAGLWIYLRAVLLVLAVPVGGLLGYLSDISGTHRWAVVTLLSGAALLISAFAAAVDAATGVVVHLDRRCGREGADIRIPAGQAVR